MTKAAKYLVHTGSLDAADGIRVRHPLNPKSDVLMHRLGDRVGMQRAHLSIARVEPGKESFVPHAHSVQEEFLFILEGHGMAEIDGERFPVGPGDYLGFPVDGAVHHLINDGAEDLVCLMGGERTEVEVARYPTAGKIGIQHEGGMTIIDDSAGERLPFSAFIADEL